MVLDGEGGVDIYVATQWLHADRDQVAPCLDLAPERVRIHLAGVAAPSAVAKTFRSRFTARCSRFTPTGR